MTLQGTSHPQYGIQDDEYLVYHLRSVLIEFPYNTEFATFPFSHQSYFIEYSSKCGKNDTVQERDSYDYAYKENDLMFPDELLSKHLIEDIHLGIVCYTSLLSPSNYSFKGGKTTR